jgi:hypothetical protein
MKQALVRLAAFAALALATPAAAFAQIQSVDPNTGAAWQPGDAPAEDQTLPPEPQPSDPWTPVDRPAAEPPVARPTVAGSPSVNSATPPGMGDPQRAATTEAAATVPREDIFTAAENVFGKGAEGLAGIIEDILKDQGEPIAYIAGEEASGAFILGARWGSGMMRHRIEGDRAVYWTGPSIGFDVGADASKVFILVYNLHDAQQLFRRYPGGEGRAYLVGGFTATYLRRGDVVLIPIRLGVGVRLGVNAGYMRFSEKNRWLPF